MNIKKCTNVSGRALHLYTKSPLWQVGIRHTKKPNGERALARDVRARETQL